MLPIRLPGQKLSRGFLKNKEFSIINYFHIRGTPLSKQFIYVLLLHTFQQCPGKCMGRLKQRSALPSLRPVSLSQIEMVVVYNCCLNVKGNFFWGDIHRLSLNLPTGLSPAIPCDVKSKRGKHARIHMQSVLCY